MNRTFTSSFKLANYLRNPALSTAVFCAFLWACPGLYAADLLNIYDQALNQDPRLKQALAQRNAAQQAKPLAVAGLLPNVNITAESSSDNPAIVNPNLFNPSSAVVKDHGYLLSASQPLINAGLFFNVNQAQSIYNQADATYVDAEQALIVRVAEAYFNVLKAEDNLTFVQAEKEAVAQQLRQTEEKFKVGLLAITDVNDFRARFDDSVASEISAQNTLYDTKEQLRIITGEPVTVLSPLTPQLPLETPKPTDIEAWVEFAQKNNPLMAAAKFNMEAKKSAVDVERSQHYPTLNVQGAYGESRSGVVTNPGDISDTGWSVLFQAQMNLFAGGGIQANVNKAQYNYEDARYIFEQVRRETVSNVRIAYRGVLSSIERVNASQQALISAQSAFDANQASYEVGTKTAVDVLDSLSNLYDQERNLALAKYDYILDILRLKKAAGTLSIDDVRHANTWLVRPKPIVDEPIAERTDAPQLEPTLEPAPSATETTPPTASPAPPPATELPQPAPYQPKSAPATETLPEPAPYSGNSHDNALPSSP